jgi:putative transposase
MKRSKFTDEQILAIVKEGEAGRKVADLCRANGITEQTYYRWKAKYGGMELSEMQRLKQLEDENRRLKQIVAEQTLDIQALKAVVAKNVWSAPVLQEKTRLMVWSATMYPAC